MAAPKGKTPEHVHQKAKKICNPRPDHPVIAILSEIEDPRKPSLFFKYPLTSIWFMALITVICGATDWVQLAFQKLDNDLMKGQARWENEVKKSKENRDEKWLKKLLETVLQFIKALNGKVKSRKPMEDRNRVGARNLAIIRKIALNGLLKEDSLKKGIATKKCAAACDPSYRDKVLKKLF